jgi:hypothetical protein
MSEKSACEVLGSTVCDWMREQGMGWRLRELRKFLSAVAAASGESLDPVFGEKLQHLENEELRAVFASSESLVEESAPEVSAPTPPSVVKLTDKAMRDRVLSSDGWRWGRSGDRLDDVPDPRRRKWRPTPGYTPPRIPAGVIRAGVLYMVKKCGKVTNKRLFELLKGLPYKKYTPTLNSISTFTSRAYHKAWLKEQIRKTSKGRRVHYYSITPHGEKYLQLLIEGDHLAAWLGFPAAEAYKEAKTA